MPISIKFYPAGCGDAIRIKFCDGSKKPWNIFIDSGYVQTFNAFIRRDIFVDFQTEEKINLWVVTHMDEDHINGVVGFFRVLKKAKKQNLLKEIWFNCFENFSITDDTSSKAGIDKAIKVREYLSTDNLCPETILEVTNELEPRNIGDAILTILSPDRSAYSALESAWQKLEEAYWERKTLKTGDDQDSPPDDGELIEKLAARPYYTENVSDIANRSSIAFLFEHAELSILMLGDSHPSIVIESIKTLNNLRGKILEVDYIKLSHHASKQNYHYKLLEIVKCDRFIISSCAQGCDGLPNKETLAKILFRKDRTKRMYFYFNYDNKRLRNMFNIEDEKLEEYNFECIFPNDKSKGLIIGKVTDE